MPALTPLLYELLHRYPTDAGFGVTATSVPKVEFFWARQTIPRTPLVYDAGVIIIGQGRKVGYLGDRVFRYDPATYLVVGVNCR